MRLPKLKKKPYPLVWVHAPCFVHGTICLEKEQVKLAMHLASSVSRGMNCDVMIETPYDNRLIVVANGEVMLDGPPDDVMKELGLVPPS